MATQSAFRSAVKASMRLLPLSWSRSIRFRYHGGRWPRLRNPVWLSEKINWRILHDRREIFAWTCDKLEMKRRVVDLAPGVLLPTVLWSGVDVRELDELNITGQWILKPNGGSQDIIVGRGQPNVAELSAAMKRWKRRHQWKVLGETAYRDVAPGAILEQWIGSDEDAPYDYKVLVFHGVAHYVQVHSTRFSHHESSLYTREWVRVPVDQRHIPPRAEDVPRPPHLDDILRIAEQISAGFDFMRVDLYDTEEGVWFGETSPYTWSGLRPFKQEWFEVEAGDLWTLPKLTRSGRELDRRSATE